MNAIIDFLTEMEKKLVKGPKILEIPLEVVNYQFTMDLSGVSLYEESNILKQFEEKIKERFLTQEKDQEITYTFLMIINEWESKKNYKNLMQRMELYITISLMYKDCITCNCGNEIITITDYDPNKEYCSAFDEEITITFKTYEKPN